MGDKFVGGELHCNRLSFHRPVPQSSFFLNSNNLSVPVLFSHVDRFYCASTCLGQDVQWRERETERESERV